MTTPALVPLIDNGGELVRTVGRLLRTLRIACGMDVEAAAVAAEISSVRLRELEAGAASLEYLEALRLAKSYMLCPSCFRKHFEGALDREVLGHD